MVKARVIKDMPELKLVGRSLGPLAEGQNLELEPWEALVLERLGYVELTQPITLAEVRRLTLVEERSSGLGALPPDFYKLALQKLQALKMEGRPEAQELKASLEALIQLRLPKLLEGALDPRAVKNLTPEEASLVHHLARILHWWERELKLTGLGGGDDEARVGGGDRLMPPKPKG